MGLSDLRRARKLLTQLHKQLIEVVKAGYPHSDLILHGSHHIDGRLVEKVIGVSEPEAWPAHVRVVPTDWLGYYEQKNFGAQRSDAELIDFLDSDVIPEPGWLAGLLEAFQDLDVQVVSGNENVPLERPYSKALALF
jgi:glycosyltransferase involved in cell wall biosynthesis